MDLTQQTNLFLCGFMGCGKSTVGRMLAGRMGREFVDIDAYIEAREGRRIRSIFEAEGEAAFRAMETRAVRALAARRGLVAAAGGGAFLRRENVWEARRGGVIILLDAPLAAIRERLRGDRTRPLLQTADPAAELERLYREREPAYRAAADYTVDAGAPASVVAERILALFPRACGGEARE